MEGQTLPDLGSGPVVPTRNGHRVTQLGTDGNTVSTTSSLRVGLTLTGRCIEGLRITIGRRHLVGRRRASRGWNDIGKILAILGGVAV